MIRQRPEQALHMHVAAFLRVALRPPTVWTTFPAGGGGRTRGAILKAMGLKPGFPDLIVIHPMPIGAGLGCIVVCPELKAARGARSADQVDTHEALTVANAHVGVCKSIEDVAALLERHGVPVYARVMAGGGIIADQIKRAA
jgi:hypothetical protein